MQQILSTSGSPCIPNPNKQAIQTVTPQSEIDISTTTRSLTEKIGQIERLFLMGNGFFMFHTNFCDSEFFVKTEFSTQKCRKTIDLKNLSN